MDATMTLRRPALRDRKSPAPFPGVQNGQSDNGRLSDEDLIALVGARDRDAFGELYRRYTRPVLGLALRRLGARGPPGGGGGVLVFVRGGEGEGGGPGGGGRGGRGDGGGMLRGRGAGGCV